MTYAEALMKGLGAARSVAEATAAIRSVLELASVEVSAVLQAPLRFTLECDGAEIWTRVDGANDAGTVAKLADLKLGAIGFPVTVRWNRQVRMPASIADFAEVLGEVLADPSVAKEIAEDLGRARGSAAR